jgi:HAE1 family hydrophobic/amphiphilic exporter-1
VRPILMTALTTVFGLIPMTLAEPPSEGIDYRALATCVAGGLTVSTFFTLWIVPLAYTLVDDLAQLMAARVRSALRPLRARTDGPADRLPASRAST